MQRDLRLYLLDIRTQCEDIQQFLAGVTFAEYEQSRMLRKAVERSFEIIGEALSQARRDYPELKHQVGEHKQIVNFRHRIIMGISPWTTG